MSLSAAESPLAETGSLAEDELNGLTSQEGYVEDRNKYVHESPSFESSLLSKLPTLLDDREALRSFLSGVREREAKIYKNELIFTLVGGRIKCIALLRTAAR